MSFYQLNNIYLKELAPSLYEHIKINEALMPIILQLVEGEYNFRVSQGETTCFLHSLYDKEEELQLMFAHVPEDVELIILLGLGCGYGLTYIRDHYPNLQTLVLVEPCLQIFQAFLHEKSLVAEFINVKNTTFIINVKPEEAMNLIVGNLTDNAKSVFVTTLSYRFFCAKYNSRLQSLVSERLRNNSLNFTTISYLTKLWIENTLYNLKTERVLLDDLYKTIFQDRPVVIISAGPSLQKHLPYLNELKKKAILLAVGSSVKILDKNGIIPHFRVAVDGHKMTEDLIFDETLSHNKEVPLIYVNQIYKGIVEKYEGKKFLMLLESDMLGAYIYNKMQESYQLVPSSHSVANVTLNFLCFSGCKQVILLGQDMCYYDEKLYTDGREMDEEYDKESWIVCQDVFGNQVYSVKQYTAIKNGYEITLRNYPYMKVINATEGGLGVEGTTLMPLSKVMTEVLIEELDCDIVQTAEKVWLEKYNKALINKQQKALIEIQQELMVIKKINEQRLYLLRKIYKNKTKGISKNRLDQDLRYLLKTEEQFLNNPLYCRVILGTLYTKNKINKMFYEKEVNDVTERECKIAFGAALELEKYIEMIEDYLNGEGLQLCQEESSSLA